ncbi:MAG: MarR family transcriptional regulator [Candidatus Lindowbacteria bacterium]|nr:MarR family transcriptional regulator [Candidatus Lindowbacteria bacterium]
MTSNDKIDKYNKLLAIVYSNLMLREIDGIRNGSMKDLTFHEIHTIELVGNLGEGTVSQIAGEARVTQSTMSTMVDKLVKKGLVQRTRSESDRRLVSVKLTKKGKLAYREHENVHREVTRSWLSILDEKEQKFLLDMMEKMASLMPQK